MELSWNDLEHLLGKDLTLFVIFMSHYAAGSILEGLQGCCKGAGYLKSETLEQMEDDMSLGILQESLEFKLQVPSVHMKSQTFHKGLDMLMQAQSEQGIRRLENYFSYVSEWDAQGHNWLHDSPVSMEEWQSQDVSLI